MSARIVKARIEKTLLKDVALYIKEVFTREGCFLTIRLDLERIELLKIELTIDQVARAIVAAPKLKVKDKGITILSADKLRIEPPDQSRDRMYFSLQ